MKDRQKVHTLPIKALNNRQKMIRVFLPDGYESGNERYPVLYMADGQNLVDPSPYSGYSWDVAHAADTLQKNGKIPGVIIVGIDSDPKRRIFEYSGAFSQKGVRYLAKRMPEEKIEAEGKIFAEFLVSILKPMIDEIYRTIPDREHTGFAGSSCGGVIALYIGTWYSNIFGVIGAFSPAYWFVKPDLIQRIGKADFVEPMYIYQDMGTKEERFFGFVLVSHLRHFDRLLRNKLTDSSHIEMVIDKNATHTELFWQTRFPHFLESAYSQK